MGQFADLEQRIDEMSARAGSRPDRGPLPEIDAMLCEGYARALVAEGRIKRLDRRLEALVAGPVLGDATEIRAVVRERKQLARGVARLRARLTVLRDIRGGHARADSRVASG